MSPSLVLLLLFVFWSGSSQLAAGQAVSSPGGPGAYVVDNVYAKRWYCAPQYYLPDTVTQVGSETAWENTCPFL